MGLITDNSYNCCKPIHMYIRLISFYFYALDSPYDPAGNYTFFLQYEN